MPLIFSDDLTGACDVGAQCLGSGWRVRVEFGARGWDAVAPARRDEVVVADLETRRLSPRQAEARAEEAGRSFLRRGQRPVVFKMDSTLRGNYLVEARALRRALKVKRTWFVPANPGQGRWTVEGRVFVNGIALERTEYARDPLHPVKSGLVGGGKAVCLGLDGDAPRKARIISADAVSPGDLERISRMVGPRELVFGASAIAKFLVGKPAREIRQETRLTGRWLGIFGSLNPLTERQLRAVEGMAGVRVSWLKPESLLAGKIPSVPAGARAWLLALEPSTFRHRLAGRGALQLGNRIAGRLGDLAAACRTAFQPSGLILSGGLTAMGVCGKMGIAGLVLSEEIIPGLVASRAVWMGPALEIITKPGGFGSDGAIVEILKRIRRA